MIGAKFSQLKQKSFELPSIDKFRLTIIIVFALIYAFIFANFSSSSFSIIDRVNYVNYAKNSGDILAGYLYRGNILSLISNEPIWLWINSMFRMFMEPELIVKTIIFISAFLSAFCFLRLSPKNIIFVMIFLFIPQIMKNYVVHLRQGFGISIFMLGMLFSDWRRLLFCGISPLIHSSMFFTIMFLQVDNVIDYFKKKPKFSITMKMIIYSVVSFVLCINLKVLLILFGDRRLGAYDFSKSASSSGLGWAFWLCVLILMLLSGTTWMKKHSSSIYAIVFYLVSYFLLQVTARIFESSLFLILISCLSMTTYRKLSFVMAMMLYGFIQWQGYRSFFFIM